MDVFIERSKWQRSPNGALGLFKIHSTVTASVLLFLGFSLLCLQCFTDTIECTNYGDKQIQKAMNHYCWSKGTYEIPRFTYTRSYGRPLPNSVMNRLIQEHYTEDNTYRSYFQYTWIALLFQALLCHLPHVLWKYLESKLLRTDTADMTGTKKMMVMLGYIMTNAKVKCCIFELLKKLIWFSI